MQSNSQDGKVLALAGEIMAGDVQAQGLERLPEQFLTVWDK